MLLSRYKEWVKRHPGIVQNLDWLLLLTVWNPSRTNGGYEFTYEAYHAALGLLSLWHQNIIDEGELPTSRPAPYLWLDAIEYLETLIELRGMHLESVGKMSRYGPLMVVEIAKAVLKMAAWSRYSGRVFLRRPTPEDLHHFESELGLQDILASLDRLRRKYTQDSPQQLSIDGTGAVCDRSHALGMPPAVPVRADCGAGCAQGPSSGPAATAARDGAGPATRPVGCGAGCCSTSGSPGSIGGGQSYGFRQYLGEQLGQWAAAVVPRSVGASGSRAAGASVCARAAAAAGSSGTGSSSHGPGCGAAAAATWQFAVSPHREEANAAGGGTSPGSAWPQQDQQCQYPREAAAVRGDAGSAEDPDAHMGRNLLWLSELLSIWRPVVYVTLLKRYGRRSWRPWAASLAVDLLSGHFHRRGQQHLATAAARAAAAAARAAAAAAAGGDSKGAPTGAPPAPRLYGAGTSLLSVALARSLAAPGITPGEDRELYDRRRKLLLYALRSPFLEATTLSWLATLRDATRHLPLLGYGAEYLHSLAETFTAYYCYTSGSN